MLCHICVYSQGKQPRKIKKANKTHMVEPQQCVNIINATSYMFIVHIKGAAKIKAIKV